MTAERACKDPVLKKMLPQEQTCIPQTANMLAAQDSSGLLDGSFGQVRLDQYDALCGQGSSKEALTRQAGFMSEQVERQPQGMLPQFREASPN